MVPSYSLVENKKLEVFNLQGGQLLFEKKLFYWKKVLSADNPDIFEEIKYQKKTTPEENN